MQRSWSPADILLLIPGVTVANNSVGRDGENHYVKDFTV